MKVSPVILGYKPVKDNHYSVLERFSADDSVRHQAQAPAPRSERLGQDGRIPLEPVAKEGSGSLG